MSVNLFAKLGICQEILDVIRRIGWDKPTEIQSKAIPLAFRGKDIVGLAETGSGKTAAFAIPILQALITKPRHNFSLILTPTRELALQLKAQFLQLGEDYGLKVICLVGGQHVEDQCRELKSSKFHVIIGTLGRVVYHIDNTKELRLNKIYYLVLDEADRMLDDTFEDKLSVILSKIPISHKTFLFSATMSTKVQKIQEICTNSPSIIEVNYEYGRVKKLDHAFVFLPDQERDVFLLHLLSSMSKNAMNNRTIVFTTTWRESFRIAFLLKLLSKVVGGTASPLNGAMQQDKRQEALFGFRTGSTNILVATDLAARGLDIPDVDLVVNYDVPRRPTWSDSAKAYIHRVGRTARAGRLGRAVTLVTPYSATRLKAVEFALEERIPQLPWPGGNCIGGDVREQLVQADKSARAKLRERDKRKRLLQKRRSKNREQQAESFANPVKF